MNEAPCRTTQHCTIHNFCHRCSPELAEKAKRILVVLRLEMNNEEVTRAYYAVARILTHRERERCTHTRAMHDRHHQEPAPGCPWCMAEEEKHQ